MKPLDSTMFARTAVAAVVLWGAGLTARADYPSEVLALQPLTYWRFSETGPFNVTATNVGTLGAVDNGAYSDPTYSQGQPGALFGSSDTAARFDGTSSKIDVPFDAALNPASFTVECWAKVQGGAGSYRSPVTSRENANGVIAGYIFYAGSGNTWEFWTGNGAGWNALTTPATTGGVVIGAWTHLVGTYDAPSLTMSFYINGALVMQSTNVTVVPVGTAGTPRPLRIGSGATESPGSFWFNGSVDEVAVYPSVLTAGQVAANYAVGTTNGAAYPAQVLALNPGLYLRLDDTSTNPAATNLGSLGTAANGRYQSVQPSATDLDSPAFPGFGSANSGLVFDGNGQAMAIGYTNIPVPWTMSCWVNRQDAPGVSAVLMYSPSGGIKLEQYGSATRNVGFTAYGIADYTFDNYSAPTGTWAQLSFVSSSSGTLLYANGELVDSNAATITLPMTSLASPSGDLLAGTVDEVATFNRALLQGQVKTLYLTAVGDQNPPAFANDVPIASPAGTLYATVPFSLSIDVYGAGPLGYQWRKDGTVVGTSATYVKAAASAADDGNYDVIVSNAFGSITSAVFTVSINPAIPASVVQPPVPRQVYPGGTAAFTVTADGTEPITYQWKKGGANIAGATNSTLIITNAGSGDAATYSVGVTNVAGGAVSAGAALTLRTPTAGTYESAIVASGPAAYWRLGESSGTTAFDFSGSHDAVYTNVTLGVPGYSASDPDTAVSFDPANPNGPGAVTLADPSPFQFISATPSFSLEAWVNFNDLTGVQRVFSYGGPGFHGIAFGINTAGGLRFTTYGVQDYNLSLATPMASNTWYHLAGVANGGSFYFYLNGLPVGSIASIGPGISSPGAPFALGRNPLSTALEPVNGTIDEAAVYNRALTPDEILTHYSLGVYGTTTTPFVTLNPSSQTVAAGSTVSLTATVQGSLPISYQWKKDGVNVPGATSATLSLASAYFTDAGSYVLWATNGVGYTNTAAATLTVLAAPTFANLTNDLVLHLTFDGDYNDSSGNGNTAYAQGSVPFIPGKIGQAVHIATTPGVNYLALSPASDLAFDETASFTVSFWTRYTARFNDTPIIGNSVNSTYQVGWVFTDEGGQLEWSLVSTADSGTYLRDPVGPAVIGDGAWHNVIGVVDRAAQLASAYVDGVLDGSWSIAGLGTLDYGNPITIGQDPTGAYGSATFDLDDVGIWRRAITAYEAASVYGAGQSSGESFDVNGPVKVSVNHVGTNIDVSWQAGTLLQSTSVTGTYTPVPGATVPFYRTSPTNSAMFFRVQQ
jgi:hypothetical protein